VSKLENYELTITWTDGNNRTYMYPSLAEALNHAVEVASHEVVTRIEVWFSKRVLQFGYSPPPDARGG